MAVTDPTPAPGSEPIDDYHIQTDPGQLVQPASHHVLGVLNALLLIVLAVLSFALFWVAATLLGAL